MQLSFHPIGEAAFDGIRDAQPAALGWRAGDGKGAAFRPGSTGLVFIQGQVEILARQEGRGRRFRFKE